MESVLYNLLWRARSSIIADLLECHSRFQEKPSRLQWEKVVRDIEDKIDWSRHLAIQSDRVYMNRGFNPDDVKWTLEKYKESKTSVTDMPVTDITEGKDSEMKKVKFCYVVTVTEWSEPTAYSDSDCYWENTSVMCVFSDVKEARNNVETDAVLKLPEAIFRWIGDQTEYLGSLVDDHDNMRYGVHYKISRTVLL